MNKSIVRHFLTSITVVIGIIPGTKILVPVITFLSQNIDSIWSAGAVLAGSAVGLYKAWKYGREE